MYKNKRSHFIHFHTVCPICIVKGQGEFIILLNELNDIFYLKVRYDLNDTAVGHKRYHRISYRR